MEEVKLSLNNEKPALKSGPFRCTDCYSGSSSFSFRVSISFVIAHFPLVVGATVAEGEIQRQIFSANVPHCTKWMLSNQSLLPSRMNPQATFLRHCLLVLSIVLFFNNPHRPL